MNTQNILILPGYYYLYALYADYGLNNAFFSEGEDTARMRAIVRAVQEVREVMAPFRKSWALRLFTERTALARFSPHLVNEVLRELRALVQEVGPPAGWEETPSRRKAPRNRPPIQSRAKTQKPAGVRTRWEPDPRPASPPIVAPPFLPNLSA